MPLLRRTQDKTEQWTCTESSRNAEISGVQAIAQSQSKSFFLQNMSQKGKNAIELRSQSFKGRTIALDCVWGRNSLGVHTSCVATGFGFMMDPGIGHYMCARMQGGMHMFREAEYTAKLDIMHECRHELRAAKARD